MRALRYCLTAVVGWTAGSACGIGDTLGWPTVNFTCEPAGPEQPPCPDNYNCCSDDPTSIAGIPLFSNESNDRSMTGLCVDGRDIVSRPEFLEGCPIPCNPTWDRATIDNVCEPDRVCCQTKELVEADCIFDEAEGQWRPMDGRDAEAALLAGQDRWGDGTHQDPAFEGCESLAGSRDNPLFVDCVRSLTVANQRGYCMGLQPGQPCPVEEPEYVDACERMNG